MELERLASDLGETAYFGFGLIEILFRLSIQRLIFPYRRQQVRYRFQRRANLTSHQCGPAFQGGELLIQTKSRLGVLESGDIDRILAERPIAQVTAGEQHPAT
jgi:hypothetical protein